jgi:hypothetical protein
MISSTTDQVVRVSSAKAGKPEPETAPSGLAQALLSLPDRRSKIR